ncbi:hypothetical protein [Roseimaritima sediminicola]|uniref:hypothetical protein n=1 Tax=Roseimaritima sediminicola TaxID=2662066 RepID=UPI0012984EBF|nr:hypothetical protein [Roseimaritima sediminicola]
MAELSVQWKHEGFSHDAGRRDSDEVEGTAADSVHTGVLTDEHQEVTDGRPVLVEDVTERVYRAADLPPDTRVIVPDVTAVRRAMIDKAKQAGFTIVPR